MVKNISSDSITTNHDGNTISNGNDEMKEIYEKMGLNEP